MNDAGEIIKSGAGEKIADLVNKLAGPLAEEVGMMFGDMSMKLASIGHDMHKLILFTFLLMSSGLSLGQESVANVVKRSSDAVVLIVTSDSNGQETALGSGFLISADGEIITNFTSLKVLKLQWSNCQRELSFRWVGFSPLILTEIWRS